MANTKSTTKQALLEEVEFLQASTSELNEYVNQQEEAIDELETELAEAELAVEAEQEANLALQSVIVDQQKKYGVLADRTQIQELLLNLVPSIVNLKDQVIETHAAKVQELLQDLHHMTIQRDALKDKVKDLEENPVIVWHRPGVYQFNS